ncbi:MAG: hypothetical protein FJ272_02605 [Planctomycetes bacterium]|nr:hypothetical protein [Planctomycetota bacterium]
MRRSGLAERILQMARSGEAEVVGLCGGFQMMGREIADPHGIESAHGKTDGLGLLAVTTVLAREKTLTRVSAVHAPSGHPVTGYEIHHGLTSSGALTPAIRRSDGEVIGVSAPDHRVWGTYLHGIFDADEFRRWFIDRLRQRRGLSPLGKVCAAYDLEAAFDRLADVVRRSLRIGDLYRLMGLR